MVIHSASVERFSVSCMRDFFYFRFSDFWKFWHVSNCVGVVTIFLLLIFYGFFRVCFFFIFFYLQFLNFLGFFSSTFFCKIFGFFSVFFYKLLKLLLKFTEHQKWPKKNSKKDTLVKGRSPSQELEVGPRYFLVRTNQNRCPILEKRIFVWFRTLRLKKQNQNFFSFLELKNK